MASDAAPRQHAPMPTQPEPAHFDPSDRVTELSAQPDANGIMHIICICFFCFSYFSSG